MSYIDVYKKRLNRYGNDFQSRIQAQREKDFENYLLKSVYRLDFEYEEDIVPATFERYKQDETETLHYLLTRTNIIIPNGTILMLPGIDGAARPWMVYYLENIKASGYNRYIMLKMSHFLHWQDQNGNSQESWAYMYGQENNMLKDEIRSRSRMDPIYSENLKSSFFVMPKTPLLKKDDYFEIGEEPYKEAYRVTGYDIQSSEGVEYVTVDPIYIRDLTEAPQKQSGDKEEDFFWLGQWGENNG